LKAAEAELADAEKRAEAALRHLDRAKRDVELARQAVDDAE
jgi:hypothetical protein